MKQIITILLIATILMGCNKINKKEITIIDNMVLGVKIDSFKHQYDKNKIIQKELYTKTFFEATDLVDDYRLINNNYKLDFTLSNIFDFPNFKNQGINHFGAYFPIVQEGTDNIVGLNVILGHTANAAFTIKEMRMTINLTKETKANIQAFNQNIRIDLVNKIESLLTEKYGKPKEIRKDDHTTYYVIEGKEIKKHRTDKDFIGEAVVWETKYLQIVFFKGIPNYNTFYTTIRDGYMYSLNNTQIEKANEKVEGYESYLIYSTFFDNYMRSLQDNTKIKKAEKKEILLCNAYPYISYTINNKTIKKMKLDKTNL